MAMEGMTLAGMEVARVGTEYHRSIFRAMARAQKAEIWHVGSLGQGKGNGQGRSEPPHVECGQGQVGVPQVPLLSHWKVPEG